MWLAEIVPLVRRPRKTNRRTKHEVDRTTGYGNMAIHLGFVQTGNSAIRSAVPEKPTLEPNMEWIGRPVAEIWPFEIFPKMAAAAILDFSKRK